MERKNKTVAFMTLGCKVNSYETDGLVKLFKDSGYAIVDFDEFSDVYVVNTCTVTNLSSKKSRQMLRRAKRRNPKSIVAAIGCYSQKEPETLEEMSAVDVVIGNNNKMKLLTIVENYTGENTVDVLDIGHEETVENFNISETNDKTRAFIRIQDGCNQFCSYCIIPYVRGRIRSKKVEDVMNEIKNLRDNGYKEIVFTGIHVASYGKDLEGDVDLIDLLLKSNTIEGVERLRLSSIEPTYLTDENIKRLQQVTKLANHFHLSLQSGSDSILKRMNRNYRTRDYLEVVKALRENFNDPAITTDIIVAFPKETDEAFQETCDFVKVVQFSQIHVFKYSKREGTKAAKMDGHIHGNVASERSQILRDLTDQLENEYIQSQIGTTHNVLIETFDEEHNICTGHTGNYLNVALESKVDLTNEFINVKIDTVVNRQIFASIERS